jgi:hypothetical protein
MCTLLSIRHSVFDAAQSWMIPFSIMDETPRKPTQAAADVDTHTSGVHDVRAG